MCDHAHQREDTPDPLTEFLAQLLADIPDIAAIPVASPAPLTPSPPPLLLDPAPYFSPSHDLACQWVSPGSSPLICGAPLFQDRKFASDHFRNAHNVRGNEKVHVYCHWRGCHVPPMLRGSLVRHVLEIHLRLLKWQCGTCGRVFSRKAVGHACADSTSTM